MQIKCPKCGAPGDTTNAFCDHCGTEYNFDPRFFSERRIPTSTKVNKILKSVLPLAVIVLLFLLVAMYFMTPSVILDLPEGPVAEATAKAKADALELAILHPDSTPRREFKFTAAEANWFIRNRLPRKQQVKMTALDAGGLYGFSPGSFSIYSPIGPLGTLPVAVCLVCLVDDQGQTLPSSVKVGWMPGWGLTGTAATSILAEANESNLFIHLCERLDKIFVDETTLTVKLKK